MCFSATASFTASGILFLIGTGTIVRARQQKEYMMFAAIPFLFAIQQACEGMIWLKLQANQGATPYVYTFLFFAMIVWPIWFPLALRRIEPKTTKRLMSGSLIVGILISVVALLLAVYTKQQSVSIQHCHIYYGFELPFMVTRVFGLFYLVATVFPFFLSSIRQIKRIGYAMVFSYILTYIFYNVYLVSVWCFFAALISAMIYTSIPKKNERIL